MTASAIGALALAAAALAIGMIPLGGAGIPRRGSHPDRAALADAGWPHGTARWELVRLGALIGGIAVARAAGLAPAVGMLAGLLPSIAIRVRAQGARDRARGSVAQLLLATHALLRSGIPLPEAVRRAAAGCADRLARRPFEHAIERFDLGDPLGDALGAAAATAGDRRLAATLHTLALGVSERLPIDRAASLLEAVAERAVYDQRLDAEIRARTAGVRAQCYLLAAIVPCLALYLVATMPGLGATLSTPLGTHVLIPVAATLELGGIALSRRIVRGATR
ncbi:MAG TPA: type II secretion system F family protein [Candidatus Limnocylindria bacterium]|nr:type II secretion system F family protein [Candidatus Limnocylindria bacterium]